MKKLVLIVATIYSISIYSQVERVVFELEKTPLKVSINPGVYRSRLPGSSSIESSFRQPAFFAQVYFPFKRSLDTPSNFERSTFDSTYYDRLFTASPLAVFHLTEKGGNGIGLGQELSFKVAKKTFIKSHYENNNRYNILDEDGTTGYIETGSKQFEYTFSEGNFLFKRHINGETIGHEINKAFNDNLSNCYYLENIPEGGGSKHLFLDSCDKILESIDESPQLPYGYPTSILISFLKFFFNSSKSIAFEIVFFGIKCCVLNLNLSYFMIPSITLEKLSVVTPFHS